MRISGSRSSSNSTIDELTGRREPRTASTHENWNGSFASSVWRILILRIIRICVSDSPTGPAAPSLYYGIVTNQERRYENLLADPGF